MWELYYYVYAHTENHPAVCGPREKKNVNNTGYVPFFRLISRGCEFTHTPWLLTAGYRGAGYKRKQYRSPCSHTRTLTCAYKSCVCVCLYVCVCVYAYVFARACAVVTTGYCVLWLLFLVYILLLYVYTSLRTILRPTSCACIMYIVSAHDCTGTYSSGHTAGDFARSDKSYLIYRVTMTTG